MPVLQPLWRHYRDNFQLSCFPGSKCGVIHGDLGRHARPLHIVHSFGICGHQMTKVPKVCGNPLAALGCQLVEGVLYVSKLPVTADGKVSTSATSLAHVGCVCHVSGGTRG